MFTHSIVRRPAATIVDGITTADLGRPDYELALKQHDAYIEALERCGVDVTVLEADERYPDSCFVEDPAIVTERCAVITRLGADSRRGEEEGIEAALRARYAEADVRRVEAPGTVEGGDIMRAGNHFYIGLSARTNADGARQMTEHLGSYGYTALTVPLREFLHLKTGLSYLEYNNLLVAGEFARAPAFAEFNRIVVPPQETYAANSIWMNGTVIVPAGYPGVEQKIRDLGYETIAVDVSEFRKIDGGLSCLSLRLPG